MYTTLCFYVLGNLYTIFLEVKYINSSKKYIKNKLPRHFHKRSENVQDTLLPNPWEFTHHLPGGKMYKFQQEIHRKQILWAFPKTEVKMCEIFRFRILGNLYIISQQTMKMILSAAYLLSVS